MQCNHDPLYRINNEAAGGAGCPICATSRNKRRVMVSDSNGQRYDREWFQREVIDARNADAAQPDQQYASLPQLTKTATVYNDWQTFVDACDDLDGYGMMGDRD